MLDNLRIHHSLEAQAILKDSGYRTLFLPPSSSHLNPIETTWSWFKNLWRKEVLADGDLVTTSLAERADMILSALTPE